VTDEDFEVTVSAGTMRPEDGAGIAMPHAWTEAGVVVEAPFTGAHLLHVAAAGCVLNDLYREARGSGVDLDGVRVRARGGFDVATWSSTGITYDVEIESGAEQDAIERLLAVVDEVAEIPRALRTGTTVARRPVAGGS
jgi:hypothetical protein